MAIDPDDPVDPLGDLIGNILQGGHNARDLAAALGGQIGRAGGEQHFGGTDKAIPHDAHPFAPGQNLPQLAKEF